MAVTKDEDRYFLSRFDGYRFHQVRLNAAMGNCLWMELVTNCRALPV